jgi:hypothetical protein
VSVCAGTWTFMSLQGVEGEVRSARRSVDGDETSRRGGMGDSILSPASNPPRTDGRNLEALMPQWPLGRNRPFGTTRAAQGSRPLGARSIASATPDPSPTGKADEGLP